MDIIIGAGVTGLTYANYSDKPYLMLEADDHTGGYCNTILQDGFVWDYSGHFFHFRNQEIADFFMDRMETGQLVSVARHAQIKYKDRLVDFPFQTHIHQLPEDEYQDCVRDLEKAGGTVPSSFKEMLYARFGKSIAEKFLIPYNQKLYATDLNRLDVNAMGRFFPVADRDEILRGGQKTTYNTSFLYPRGGAIQYIRALEKDLPKTSLSLNEKVLAVDLNGHKVTTDKREMHYDHLISTIPLPRFLSLCKFDYDRSAFDWNQVLVFNLGFDKPSTDKENHWIYFPEEKYCFYRVGFYSNIIPSEKMSLYVEIGLRAQETVDIEAARMRVINDLRTAGIITNQSLVSWHYVLMNPAYVHVTSAGNREVERLKEVLGQNDVFTIGRYGSWNYSSIEDNMIEAISLSKELN